MCVCVCAHENNDDNNNDGGFRYKDAVIVIVVPVRDELTCRAVFMNKYFPLHELLSSFVPIKNVISTCFLESELLQNAGQYLQSF